MANLKIIVPDMGDFKDVEVIEVLVKDGQTINKKRSEQCRTFYNL